MAECASETKLVTMETEPLCLETQIMDESLEFIFSSMIRQGDVSDAIDFIKSLDINIMPSKTVLRTIIFEVLMKSDDIRCLALSSDYLVTILNAFPPNTENMRAYYYDSTRDCQGYLDDLWTVFSHIVNSYFYHRSIYDIEKGENTEPIKYPNCKFLLEFYVKLFSVDFEYLYVKSFQPCLVMQLLWSGSHNICLSSRTEMLLKWINDIYSDYHFVNSMGDLLGCLHEMLTLMVKCFLQARYNLSELAAFKHPCLSEIVESTVNFCKNAFNKPEKVRLFLASFSSLKCFQCRISERIIKQVTRQVSKRTYVLTLKEIVFNYMFPDKFNKKKNVKPNVNKEKNVRKRLHEKEKKSVASFDKKNETTVIHELVKKNKFGDLYEALHSNPELINATDSTGSTPLHVACQAGNFLCVTVLVKESKKDSIPNLDLTAVNSEGFTALHLAVEAKSVEIARELLSAGGSDLLNIKDKRGYKPSDWSSSKEMESFLQLFQTEMSSNDSDSTTESNIDKEAPNFKSFNDYSTYLHALTCLLGTYCELFNIYEFRWEKNDVVKNHDSKNCCHYLEEDVCSEDARIISQMPDLIAKFIESLQKNATKLQYNIDIELIPLKAFAASLTTS